MEKLTDILKQTLSKIDEINDYMFMVGEFLITDMKKIEKKCKTGFLIGIYLDSQFQEKKDEAESNEEIQKKVKEAEKLADKYIEILNVDSEIGIVSYRHKGKKKINVEEDTQNMYKGFSRILMFYNSLLINLIIEFESYISDIFMYYIQKYPEAYLSNESIKYTMISSIDDIAEIKLMIKRKTVEQIMRENIFSWFKLLKEKHKINVNIEDSFIEAYYRRNLVVHNNLIVNNDYLENIPNSIEKPQINEKLKINLKYLKKVIKDEKKIIINLLYAIDKKENDNEDVIDALTDYAYDCMRDGKWQTSTYIYNLVKDDKRMNEQDKLNCKVNYWQSMKRLNKFEDVKAEIENLDISAYEKIYKLAKEVLLEEYGNAIRTLELIYKNDITSSELEEWSLFLEFRETTEFKEFKEKHNDDFLEKEKNVNSNVGIKERIEELNNTDDNK